MADVTVHLDDELYGKASRLANLDKVSVEDLVENALRRHLDYVDVVENFSHMAPFSLENYELQRDLDYRVELPASLYEHSCGFPVRSVFPSLRLTISGKSHIYVKRGALCLGIRPSTCRTTWFRGPKPMRPVMGPR
jgi:hypothetical protein